MLYRQNVVLGAALIVASELLFASMGAAVKLAATTLDNEMIVFMRNAVGLVLLTPIVLHKDPIATLATRVPHLHLLRASAGVGALLVAVAGVMALRGRSASAGSASVGSS